jgi:hypothetical protein
VRPVIRALDDAPPDLIAFVRPRPDRPAEGNLLAAQVWLTDMSLFTAHKEGWNAWVDPGNAPVRACLLSPRLWYQGMLVEIMVTAAR